MAIQQYIQRLERVYAVRLSDTNDTACLAYIQQTRTAEIIDDPETGQVLRVYNENETEYTDIQYGYWIIKSETGQVYLLSNAKFMLKFEVV